ncbi:hypothetical protein PG5_34030 [Pseudomonas sp. G5(2012)]|nr:hypothetical protein PG5_34030 [Pseudomonas sp. G5(2012)]
MDVNDNAPCLDERVVWASIASMFAPTGSSNPQKPVPHKAHPKNLL